MKKYAKSFQVLTYAYMYLNQDNLSSNSVALQSGIISFKNLGEGFMPFNRGLITEDVIMAFKDELDKLILDIFDINIPFIEKEMPVYNY